MMPNLTPREVAAAMRILDHEIETNFSAFIRKSFATVSPGDAFSPNWHIKAIAHALDRVATGEVKRLLILMPPRHLKSICASVAFPARLLGLDPTLRIICVSYAADLAAKLANDCRAVMRSPWYNRVFPATQIDPKKNSEYEFMTTRRGSRLATSTGGVLTGRGGDIIIIDDPIKPQDAQSDARRRDCLDWYSNTLLSRLDKTSGTIVVVMQRLHVDDLAGHLLEQAGWEVLSLPAIAETAADIPIGPGLIHHRQVGELLHAEREPLEVLEELKAAMGSYNFSAQYQQVPVPAGGNMINWDWFGLYTQRPEARTGDIVVQSWDTASTTSELSSYSVGITAQIDKSGSIYLLDLVRGRWQFPDVQRKIIEAARCHRPKCILIEDQASGIGLQQTLKREGLSVIAVKPKGDKVMRMHAHPASLEAAKVFVPKGAHWLDDFRSEILAFPNGKHDDQVDALSQLMTWHEERGRRTHSIRPMWPQRT